MPAADSRTSSESDHRRHPRAKRAPRARDKAIYIQYHAGKSSQAQLAELYGLSQRRISQIIERVEWWRSGTAPSGPPTPDAPIVAAPHEKQQLDRELTRAMHQAVYRRALQTFDNAPRELMTTKTVADGREVVRLETTQRQVVPSAAPLRVAQTAAAALDRLADKPPIETPAVEPGEVQDWQIVDGLCKRRRRAEERGRVRKSEDALNVVTLCLHALVGKSDWDISRYVDDSRAAEFEFLTYFQREVIRNKRKWGGPPAAAIFDRATARLEQELAAMEGQGEGAEGVKGDQGVKGASNASIASNRAGGNDPKSFHGNEMQATGGFYSEATNRSPGREGAASAARS